MELTRFRGHLLSWERKESTMARHPNYAPEFRQQMVEHVRAGRTPGEVSREFGPTAESIRSWVKAADAEARGESLTAKEKKELLRLRREVKQLRTERDILAKATAWFARETQDESKRSTDS